MDNIIQSKNTSLQKTMHIVGSLSVIALPISLMVAFDMHFSSIQDFFVFRFIKPEYSVERLLSTLMSSDHGFRLYTHPHLVAYIGLPLFIISAMSLAYIQYKQTPWHAMVGLVITSIGTVFMGGVFGAWLSFASLANIPADQAGNLIPVLKALTAMQGPLALSSALSALTFIGMIILGFGLYTSRVIPRWSAIFFILGNMMILAFIDLDNLMFIGALLQFIALFPIVLRKLHIAH